MTHIYLIAGEPSGDFLGAQVMKALKAQTNGDVTFSGIGGPQMEAQGLKSLFPMQELSIMGLAEVLPNLRNILKRIRQTVSDIETKKPDIVLTIDAPDFCFRVVKGVHKKIKAPPKLIHYVAPSVWAWRAGRAKKLARLYDGLICFFDFEVPYFEKEGLKTTAVGHPVVESGLMEANGKSFRDAHGISQDALTIGIFFGSRQGELKRVGPVLVDVMKLMQKPEFIVPTLPHLKESIEKMTTDVPAKVHVTTNPDEKWSAFKACDMAIAVSGTVGLELAAAGVPHIIAYKMNPLTWEVIRRVIKVKYAHLANIMAGHEIVPEFIQEDCTADKILASLLTLENNEQGYQSFRDNLGDHPSGKAAEFILSAIPA